MEERQNKPKKIAFFGHFDSSNFGNESTLQAILYHLRRFHPDAEILCISTGPEATMATHQIDAIPIAETFMESWTPRHPLLKVLRKICIGLPSEAYRWISGLFRLRHADTLIIPGTGLLTDAYGLISWGPYNLFKWSLIAKLCGCKLLFVSIGAGPIYSTMGRYFFRSILRLADFRSYRDDTTLQYLRNIGLNVDGDRVYPDLAFSLPEAVIPRYPVVNYKHKTIVGLGVMQYAGKYSVANPNDKIYDDYLNSLVKFVKWLLAHDYDVRLLSGDLADEHTRKEFRDFLRGELRGLDEERIIDEPITSVAELLAQIATTDIVVATRFHNVLLALLCNKAVLSISFHHKCESLMRAVELSDYCLDINDLKAEKLIEKFCDLERDADIIKLSIGEKARVFREELDEQYRLIFNLI
jgi:polysaccharide pyruvyl transferase WcaK-like protein